eukprot:1181477-Prorocentrum_minimum.AAC.2
MSFPTGSSTSLATITAMLLVGTMAEEMIRAPSTPNALLPSRSSFSACASTIHSAIRFMATVVYSPLQPFHLHLAGERVRERQRGRQDHEVRLVKHLRGQVQRRQLALPQRPERNPNTRRQAPVLESGVLAPHPRVRLVRGREHVVKALRALHADGVVGKVALCQHRVLQDPVRDRLAAGGAQTRRIEVKVLDCAVDDHHLGERDDRGEVLLARVGRALLQAVVAEVHHPDGHVCVEHIAERPQTARVEDALPRFRVQAADVVGHHVHLFRTEGPPVPLTARVLSTPQSDADCYTSFHGFSCANNGKGALNTPE